MQIGKIKKNNLGLLIMLLGEAGVGKTSEVYSLPEKELLFLNAEDGTRSIQSWGGDLLDIKSWGNLISMACLIGGYNPNVNLNNPKVLYSKKHYENCVEKYPELAKAVEKYNYIFLDSLTKLDFFSIEFEKNKGSKGFELWGNHGSNMIELFNQLRRSNKTIICTGGHEFVKNEDTQVKEYNYLMSGKSAKNNIKYVFDNVITLVNGSDILPAQTKSEQENQGKRDERRDKKFFVCKEGNQWGFLAKERSQGVLKVIEPNNICNLIEKINSSTEKPKYFSLKHIDKKDNEDLNAGKVVYEKKMEEEAK